MKTSALAVELILDARADVGEGPIWDPLSERLVWIDIIGSKIHWYRPRDGETATFDTPKRVGSVAPRSGGGLVIAMEDGIWLLEADHRVLTKVAGLPGADPNQVTAAGLVEFPAIWMTDGKCGPGGHFWAGSVVGDGSGGGGVLWRFGTDRNLTPMVHDIKVSSSLGWSPDKRTFYYADATELWLDAFDHDPATGTLGKRRRLIEWPAGTGAPDGMAIDADGFLWIAMVDAWAVHRYSPEGRLVTSIPIPVARVASCAFGGSDLSDLYITSIRAGLTDDELAQQPLAGGLFCVRPGVRGLPVDLFGA